MNKTQPLVSVIVPCYNHEEYIEKCILSIINQTYSNIELIVIDDGSTDNSYYKIENLAKKYNFYHEKQKNIGLPATLNKMIELSQGDYISVIASDDFCEVNKIEILINEFNKLDDSYSFVFGNSYSVDANNKVINDDLIKKFINNRLDIDLNTNITYINILKGNFIPVLSTLIRKKNLKEVGMYDKNLPLEDWSMWLKLLKNSKSHFINQNISYYRTHESNMTKTMSNKLLISLINMLDREKGYCLSQNFIKEWEDIYYRTLIQLAKKEPYFVIKKIMKCNIFSFSKYLYKSTVKRIKK